MENTIVELSEADQGCPVKHVPLRPRVNIDWFPELLDLSVLHRPSALSDPMGPDFDYAREFNSLDLKAVKDDLVALMTTSQDWWPADYGHYGPLFIRMAWHQPGRIASVTGAAARVRESSASRRSTVGRTMRTSTRRACCSGRSSRSTGGRSRGPISWCLPETALSSRWDSRRSDLPAVASMHGNPTRTFTGGRKIRGSHDKRYSGERELEKPLAAVQMGLIYVNPEGPNGEPDPLAAATDIRETFGRMAMNDVETVALIAGGHTFGKAHGAADPGTVRRFWACRRRHRRAESRLAQLVRQRPGDDAITSGLEGAWTATPTRWNNEYFNNLFNYEWELTKSPAGGYQWTPKEGAGANTVPDAHDSSKRHAPMMFTTDLSLKVDPIYGPISKRFHENPQEFADAFAKAWYKLTHRDMGPISRYLGPEVPAEQEIWQDPLPAVDHTLIDEQDIAALKSRILSSGLTVSQLVATAWASASTFRGTDKRGGANGARVRLAPQKDWGVNQPAELAKVLQTLEKVQADFNASLSGGKMVSLADTIVLGGCAAIEQAAKNAGQDVKVKFTPGRTDATQENTDTESFAVLEPATDGFRNYLGNSHSRSPEQRLLDRAQLLTLTAPEMTALLGGLRVLGANTGGSKHGVFTNRQGALTNDFFANLLDMGTRWQPAGSNYMYEGRDRRTGEVKWTATNCDLIFGSNSQLRASPRSTPWRATTSCATSSPRGKR